MDNAFPDESETIIPSTPGTSSNRPIRRIARAFRKAVGLQPLPRPPYLAVESTAACNLDCPFCRYGQSAQVTGHTAHSDIERKIGTIDFDLYAKRIVPSAAEFGTRRIQLHFQGEPLLNKRLPDMIRVGKQHGLDMQFFTNGLLLKEPTMDALLDSGVDLVRFSIDGNSQDIYKLNRVGGDFETVIDILGRFVAKARARNSPVRIEWSYIVIRNNEHEVDAAARRAESLGAIFITKVLNTTDPQLMPQDPQWHRTQFKIKPCQQIFSMLNVLWNGDVVPCCYDVEGSVVLGNVKNATLTEIWNSPAFKDFRRRLARVREEPENEPELCRHCPMWK